MSGERTVPILPCRHIDEVATFYRALGFEVTYRQMRPNQYVALRRDDIELHFGAWEGFDPADSYGQCAVYVADTAALYRSFADGMRAEYGKLLVAGIPRMTRPRKRKNAGDVSGFTIIDPGGNWIRIAQLPGDDRPGPSTARADSKLAEALRTAVVLGDSHGDHRQATKVLGSTLAKHGDSAPNPERVQAMVYLAELAITLGEADRAAELLDTAAAVPLTDSETRALADELAGAQELRTTLERNRT
ncbi:bleomycin resistance protein [Nocardia iowensis]|uniref:VOC family protein n=1 Tax=Nocardia iowensis TaxID=204891 RepID=A0ABX8RIX8_NOCIO|nr:VOC family protein [Nocardia iowensis]QXN88410.1 VOC family protein [Nocardia iowensis]